MQLVQVSGKSKETNTENPCKDNRGSRSSSNAVHGLAQFRKDVVDHVASTRVLVSSPLDVLLALDGFFVKVFANLVDSSVVVVVVVVSIVVVVIVVVVGSARDASRGNQWLGGERVSVVVLFVSSLWCVLGTSSIRENSGVDTRGSTVCSSVVHLVTATVVVVVLVSVFNGLTFGEFVHFLLFLLFDTVGHPLFSETSVQAIVVIVLVVVVSIVVVGVGVVILVLVTILAAAFANFCVVLAFVFTRFLQGFLVSFDEFSHLNNVLSAMAARSTAVVRAKLELGNHVASESFISLEHGDGSATIELERGSSNPRTNFKGCKGKKKK